eukprot:g1555.t1
MRSNPGAYALYPMRRPLPPRHEGGKALLAGAPLLLPPEAGVPITWGATVLTTNQGTADEMHHAYVDVCCYTPTTIMHDVNGCQTVYATSPSLNATFAFESVALGAQHTCPHAVAGRGAHAGRFLLFSTGTGMACNTTCTGAAPGLTRGDAGNAGDAGDAGDAAPGAVPCDGQTGFFGLNVASSASPAGPWTSHDNIKIAGVEGGDVRQQTNINPSPLVLANGSVVLAFCDQGEGAPGEMLGLAFADDALGPYRRLGTGNLFAHRAEDPFIYKGRAGYHMLAHDMQRGVEGMGPCRMNAKADCSGQVGLHAFAPDIRADGGGWRVSPRLDDNATSVAQPSAYSTNVTFSDGTTFAFFRRERPELLTNADGDPTHLITGIEYFADNAGAANNHQYSFTIVQEVNLDGGYVPAA